MRRPRRRGAGLRARHTGQAGAGRRCSSPRIARSAARRRRSPAWPRRSRRCTPTRWCTTISPAWTTTTSAAAAPRRIVAFDVATATRAGYLLVPVAARVLAAAAEALGLPPAALGPDGGRAVPAGRNRGDGRRPVARPGGRGPEARAGRPDRGPSGQDRSPHPRRLHPGRDRGRGGPRRGGGALPPMARTSASPSRSPTTCWTPPEPARSWASRPVATPSWQSPPTCSVLGIDGARAEAQRLARQAVGHLERGRGAVRGVGGPGRVYCDAGTRDRHPERSEGPCLRA